MRMFPRVVLHEYEFCTLSFTNRKLEYNYIGDGLCYSDDQCLNHCWRTFRIHSYSITDWFISTGRF
jgi:hypothetical protein